MKTSGENNTLVPKIQPIKLEQILETARTLISKRVIDRNFTCHIPTIGSITTDRYIYVSMVVLRGIDVPERLIRFRTDCRTLKYTELSMHPQSCIHFYDLSNKIHLVKAYCRGTF